jgi:23S rRNA pseudouridine2605 synthase
MQQGRVVVNGETCTELGSKVVPTRDTVEVDGEEVSLPDTYIYLLVHKPEQYITSMDDPKGRPIVMDLVPDKMPRVWPVGRLDWDSAGALILTNDGKLTNLLTHPSHKVTKQYAVKVHGLLKNDDPKLDRLREGIEIEPGVVTQPAFIKKVKDNGNNTWLDFIISEGKNRQIRKMCDAIGHPVMKLRRYAIGPVTLEGLPAGSYRPLLHDEVAQLYEEVETEMPERAVPSDRALKREREAVERGGRYDVRFHGPGNKHK